MERVISLKNRLLLYGNLMRLSKQYGTLLLLFPALWSLLIASHGKPPIYMVLIFVVGAFLMRSAGCVINDIADRNFDGLVERTKERPLASGNLKVNEAILVFLALSLLAFLLVLFLNRLTIFLSVIGLILAVIYPFIKRVSFYPQVFLGAAFGWGAIMAWTAVRNSIELTPVIIMMTNIFWSTGYDTIYALIDKEDDRKAGIKSTALLFGDYVYVITSLLFLGVIVGLIGLGAMASLGVIYYISVFLTALLFLYQVAMIRRTPQKETFFFIFVFNVVVGVVVSFGFAADLNI
jgi:4-hydroxybenzoate polyprenyltransferase